MHIREWIEVVLTWIVHIGHELHYNIKEFCYELKQLLWPD